MLDQTSSGAPAVSTGRLHDFTFSVNSQKDLYYVVNMVVILVFFDAVIKSLLIRRKQYTVAKEAHLGKIKL